MRKLLLSPLRLAVGWGISPRLIGLISITAWVLLRLSIGWHFYSEGVAKRQAGSWTAAPFFANARGPLAGHFRQMVWDHDGRYRLNRNATMKWFAVYREQAATHYGFDDAQKNQAQANYSKAIKQYDWVLQENAADLEEYDLGRDRVGQFERDAQEKALRDGVSSLGGQRDTIRKEWQNKAKPALSQIDVLWKSYESAQQSVATSDQRQTQGDMRLVKPRTNRMDTSIIDRVLPYFDIVVGLCLLLGFFTPVAALAAGVFLASVFLSQFPPTTGPSSSNYQLIESLGCFVLAATGAGRFAGLDYFLHLFIRKSNGSALLAPTLAANEDA